MFTGIPANVLEQADELAAAYNGIALIGPTEDGTNRWEITVIQSKESPRVLLDIKVG